ncbi:hypothetical protein KCP70_14885 [Salmonella enterica subsp. enterica]|nr:hypothetical protein KCP70_14885 [Salmonella enterica subsp. enterica]
MSLTGVQRRRSASTTPACLAPIAYIRGRGEYQPAAQYSSVDILINGSLVKQFPIRLLVSTEIILRRQPAF